MFRKVVMGAALLVAGAALSLTAVSAQEEGPGEPVLISYEGPSAGTTIASGLSATGAGIGPDGALYVGIGGDASTEIAVPEDLQELAGTDIVYFGTTGSVARVDPETGDVTTYADGLPVTSFAADEPGSGPTDLAFIGDELYVLVTGSVSVMGGAGADYPNGIYKLEDDDSWTIVADISAFNDDNPVEFPDAAPGGNPFALDVRGGEFIISDGNYNRLIRATPGGDMSLLAQFDNVVPTGLATRDSGPVYNTHFSAFPHAPEDSHLVAIGYPSGGVQQIAGGYAQLIDVEFGADATYVLQFGDQSLDENAPPPPGRLLRLGADNSLTPVVTNLTMPTSVNFEGDTAYITSLSGDVLQVEGVSALEGIEEPAPEPTAPVASPTAPVGPISPPNTGMGDGGGSAMPLGMIIALALAGLAMASAGGLVARRSR